ncbi:hypothetical protein NL676_033418 [Syzygium grande]|nr:hypothetical protein NL676_033418 [Syzygium grande]
MGSEAEEKWEGKVGALVRGSSTYKAWPLLEDFFSLHKSTNSLEDVVTNWALEKLLATDPFNKCFSYEIMDFNTAGFESLVATMKLTAARDAEEEDGCGMSWSSAVDLIEGWTKKDLTEFYNSALRVKAERIEAAL